MAEQTPTTPRLVQLSGDLDVATVDAMHRLTASLVIEPGQEVHVDMAEVTFVDSIGIRQLMHLTAAVVGQGGSLVLTNPTDALVSVLRISGLLHEFGIEDDGISKAS